jgi:hypothetical protein
VGLVAAALLCLTSCGGSGPDRACTLIGSLAGVRVSVVKELAPKVRSVRLTVCWSGSCQEHPVDLQPGSVTVDQGCSGSGPDAACSATAVPDGTSVGFVEITDLPDGPITVSATGVRAGKTVGWPEVTVPTVLTEPNGPGCGGGARQAAVTVSAEGLR